MGIFKRLSNSLKKGIGSDDYEIPVESSDYIQVEPEERSRSKVVVRPFILEDFEDVKPVLDALREGYTIALVNIRSLRDRDLVELKRAVNKLKKTCDAIDGDLAGFGDDWVAAVPSFAGIHREQKVNEQQQ